MITQEEIKERIERLIDVFPNDSLHVFYLDTVPTLPEGYICETRYNECWKEYKFSVRKCVKEYPKTIIYDRLLFRPLQKIKLTIEQRYHNGSLSEQTFCKQNSGSSQKGDIYGLSYAADIRREESWDGVEDYVPELQDKILTAAFGKDWSEYISFHLVKVQTLVSHHPISQHTKVKL